MGIALILFMVAICFSILHKPRVAFILTITTLLTLSITALVLYTTIPLGG